MGLAYGVPVAPPHRTRTLEIEASQPSPASVSDVIAYLRVPETWPLWQSEILAVEGPEVVSEGDVIEGHARLLGFDVSGRSSIEKIATDSFHEDVIVGVRMRVTYSVTPSTRGSVITHRMEADLPAGIAGSALSVLLGWRLKRMQKRLLAALGRQAGRG